MMATRRLAGLVRCWRSCRGREVRLRGGRTPEFSSEAAHARPDRLWKVRPLCLLQRIAGRRGVTRPRPHLGRHLQGRRTSARGACRPERDGAPRASSASERTFAGGVLPASEVQGFLDRLCDDGTTFLTPPCCAASRPHGLPSPTGAPPCRMRGVPGRPWRARSRPARDTHAGVPVQAGGAIPHGTSAPRGAWEVLAVALSVLLLDSWLSAPTREPVFAQSRWISKFLPTRQTSATLALVQINRTGSSG
jgi:hypothetical protein